MGSTAAYDPVEGIQMFVDAWNDANCALLEELLDDSPIVTVYLEGKLLMRVSKNAVGEFKATPARARTVPTPEPVIGSAYAAASAITPVRREPTRGPNRIVLPYEPDERSVK